MHATLRLITSVLPGGRIEITDTQLHEGDSVDVIIQPAAKGKRESILDVLAQAPGQLAFKTVAEVDAYLHQERQQWER